MVCIKILAIYFFVILVQYNLLKTSYGTMNEVNANNNDTNYTSKEINRNVDEDITEKYYYYSDHSNKSIDEIKMFSKMKTENWSRNSIVRPHEIGEYHEGDIMFHPPKHRKPKLWPNGEIIYEIDPTIGKEHIYFKRLILDSIDQIQELTEGCLKFKSKSPSDKSYVFFQSKNDGCYAYKIGFIPGRRTIINLQYPECKQRDTVIHEIMHIVGLYHEQNRPDRDNYVTIQWENINPVHHSNFIKFSPYEYDIMDIDYDFTSIMHYSSYAFSSNPKLESITSKILGKNVCPSPTLNELDVMKVKKLYKCGNYTRSKTKKPGYENQIMRFEPLSVIEINNFAQTLYGRIKILLVLFSAFLIRIYNLYFKEL